MREASHTLNCEQICQARATLIMLRACILNLVNTSEYMPGGIDISFDELNVCKRVIGCVGVELLSLCRTAEGITKHMWWANGQLHLHLDTTRRKCQSNKETTKFRPYWAGNALSEGSDTD